MRLCPFVTLLLVLSFFGSMEGSEPDDASFQRGAEGALAAELMFAALADLVTVPNQVPPHNESPCPQSPCISFTIY